MSFARRALAVMVVWAGFGLRAQPGVQPALQAYEAGVRAENEGRLEEAVVAYTEVLHANPRSTGALRRRGSLYLRKGELQEAARDLEQAARLSASDGEVWRMLGDARLEIGRAACRGRV